LFAPETVAKPAGDSTECRNAATNELLGYSPLHTEDDLKSAIEEARQAQKNWSILTVRERIRYIKKVRDYLVENIDDLAETISRDNGKTLIDALAAEILPAIMAANYYCRHAARFLKDRSGMVMDSAGG